MEHKKPLLRHLIVGFLIILTSVGLFSFGLLMTMFLESASGTGIGFVFIFGAVSLYMFVIGLRFIHDWAERQGAQKGCIKIPSLPGGLWRWLIIPAVSILFMLFSGNIGYAYFLTMLYIIDAAYIMSVRMVHCYLFDASVFIFGAGYLANAAIFYPSRRILWVVVPLLFIQAYLSILRYLKSRKAWKSRDVSHF